MKLPAPDVTSRHTSCPHQSVLSDYVQGLADDSTAGIVDAHLESCAACNEMLSELETELLPTIDRMDDETKNALREGDIGSARFDESDTAEEDEIVRQAIASSQLAATADQAAWRLAAHHQVPVQVGPYRLLRAIGRGGMGSVYHAQHQKLHKDVALKLLPLGLANPWAVERFEREIRAAGKVNHPAIVTSTDAGTDAGYIYLAMELIQGFDLGKIARSTEPLRIADVCEIGRQIALGLAHAHQMGMVHRDIKPSNVMLDNTGKVKLLDFGLVMLNQWDSPLGELTTVGQFLGTLDYMAPEQAERSASVDHRSDLYSLGATMFRLLTGHLPVAILPNQSPLEKLRVLSHHAPLKVTTLRHDVPEPLARLIDQLLKTDPHARPASAAHVAESLETFSRDADLRSLANRTAQLPAETLDGPLNGVGSGQPPVDQAQRGGKQRHDSSGRSRFRWPLTLAAASLPFLAYLGWTLIIENAKGNLVIQSEVEGLQVQIATVDGATSDALTIHQGNQLTRLRAGSYEIKLESPTDGIVMEPEQVVLKRGETVIAKIRRETKASPLPAGVTELAGANEPAGANDWLPAGIISEELLQATYKDKSILEHLKQIHLERDFSTWMASLSILERAIPAVDKPKLGPFIQASAERKGFFAGLNCLKLSEWIPYERLDSRIAEWLDNNDEHVLQFLAECSQEMSLAPPVNRVTQWTELPLTWQKVEDWFASDRDLQHRLRLQRERHIGGGISDIRLGLPLNDYLYANFPATALAIAQYYAYNMGGYFDVEKESIRLAAKVKLTRAAITAGNLNEVIWQLNSSYWEAEVEEAEYWTLVAGFIAQRLEHWAASNETLLANRVQIQLSASESSSWIIRPAASHSVYAVGGMNGGGTFGGGMGGFGGGMGGGGMGGMGGSVYTQGLPPGASALVSESLELLAAYRRLPESLQPRAALEKVRAMLEAKGRASENVTKFFDGEWTGLSWNSDMQLQRYAPDGTLQMLGQEDQATAAAFVLYRWVNGMLESDFVEPSSVVSIFLEQLAGGRKQFPDAQKPSHWLHPGLRERWSDEEFTSKFSFMEQSSFQPSIINTNSHTSTVVGKLVMETGRFVEFRVRLGLEREGWRIRSIESFQDGKSESLLSP